MKTLSIITINRNNSKGLKRTLDSVKSQTLREFEHIIIDGASTDESVEIIREYAENHTIDIIHNTSHNVLWVSEPDGGVYEAMNKGIEIASGKRVVNSFNRSERREDKNKECAEYLLFLNSGDFLIAPDVLERVFKQHPKDDIINARCNVSDYGVVTWTSPYIPKVTLKDLYFVGLPHQSTFIRRALFEKYGLYREDFRYNSDIDFWYKAIVLGDATTAGVDVVTTDYNLDGISAKEAKNKAFAEEHRQILSQGFLPKVMPDYEQWKEERKILSKYNWIEQHKLLQKLLKVYQRICK